jgi:ComF family protein
VFPDDCRICQQPLRNISRIPVCPSCLALPRPLLSDFFCRTCHTSFLDDRTLDANGHCLVCRSTEVNFDTAYSYGSYEGTLRDLIHLYKYAKVESLSRPLSRLLIQAIPLNENFDLIQPMPMHWRKRWKRGFNQAELIAKPVASRYGLKLSANLCRKRYTAAQAGLDERQRRLNLQDSFSLRRPDEIRGRRILLIDDVLTTGSTLRAATRVLKAAGAARVTALTLARVDHALFPSRVGMAAEHHTGFDQTPLSRGGRKSQTAGTGVK